MTTVLSNILTTYRKNNDNVLLHFNEQICTHKDLDLLSNKFANYLMHLGVKKYDRVALIMDLGIDVIVAIFGIIKCGAIYVPMDSSIPTEMKNKILKETNVSLLITDCIDGINSLNIDLKKVISKVKYHDCCCFNNYLNYNHKQPNIRITENDLVYIIYTSGTTGDPKGVMISHKNIMTFMNCVVIKYNHSCETKSLCRTPISFDPFLTEIVPSIISGGQVYIQNRNVSLKKLLLFIEKYRITNFGCGPSLLFLLADNLSLVKKYNLDSLTEIYIGYEKCSTSVIKVLQQALPNTVFINGYGTSETFASSTFYLIPKIDDTNIDIPIGNVIDNEEILIVHNNRQCESNEIGEIIIRGSSVFNGYWKDSWSTFNSLKVNPIFPESNENVYYTGDLAYQDSEGNIYFVGRKDEQVKINGFRVELGEIKHVIESLDLIKECIVVYDKNKLICFYNTYDDKELDAESLKNYCKQKIQVYKIPVRWIFVSLLPRNKNGKIIKRELIRKYLNDI